MTASKIKIALFSDVLKENTDGVTYTLYNIIKRIPREKFDLLFITPYPPDDMDNFPFPVHVCNYIRFPLYSEYPLALPDFDKSLKQALDDFTPDIIHFTTPSLLGRYAVKYAKAHAIPLTSTYHTHFKAYLDYYFKYTPGLKQFIHWLVKKIMLWFYNQCVISFVPTRPILNELIEVGIEEERLMVWGRGIEEHKYNSSFKNHEYIEKIAGKNSKKILFASRLVWEKEIQTLINIYDIFSKSKPDYKMIIAGDGPQKKYMQKHMPGAIFTGKLQGKELSKIFASCDLFVFPSITETFGNVVLEAMSSGLPVVAADQGGPKGIIQHGITGLLARPKDAEDFSSKIISILDDPVYKEKLSQKATAYAKSQSWDTLCDILFNKYEDVICDSREIQKNELATIAV